MVTAQDLGEILMFADIYRCTSPTCSDNGGVCTLIVPPGFETPTKCVSTDIEADEEGEGNDCVWVLI
jgi:hypothetical protein